MFIFVSNRKLWAFKLTWCNQGPMRWSFPKKTNFVGKTVLWVVEKFKVEMYHLIFLWLIHFLWSALTIRPMLFKLATLPSSVFSPTCQVRVVRFYVSWLPPPSAAFCRLPPPPDLNHDHPRQVIPAGPQPRPSMPSVPFRTSTARIHAKCSLPDLNRENPRQVFPAGPQPRPSTPSVPCRTSTARIHAKCFLPDLNRENPRQVFPAGPQPPERMPKDMPDRMPDRTSDRVPDRMPEKNAR